MKKTLIAISAAVIALAATSCRKENIEVTPSSAPVFTATIESGSGTKTTVERVVDAKGVHYKTKWEDTDSIRVNNAFYKAVPKGDSTKADFTYSSGTAPTEPPYNAYFPATMYDGVTSTLPASYTYAEGKYNMPMYASSQTTTLEFKNICGVLAVKVPGGQMSRVDSITVTSDQRMNGAFTATAAGVLTFTSTATPTDAEKKVTLTFNPAKEIQEGDTATFYIPGPAGTHSPLTIYVSNGAATLTKTMVTKKDYKVEVYRNTVYPITFKHNGPVFSVSDNEKVIFSRGNLQATYSTSAKSYTWGFAAHQYDFIGNNPGNTTIDSQSDGAVVDLFGWSTSATCYGVDTSTSASTYSGDFVDWGTAIDSKGTWCTLKGGEYGQWTYLLESRSGPTIGGKENARFAKVKVNGIAGLLVFPDVFEWNESQMGLVPAYLNVLNVGWSFVQEYTLARFSAMDSAGVVFLPAAGYRKGLSVNSVSSSLYYWSRTASGDQSAYCIRFEDTSFSTKGNDKRFYGKSVRLVTYVK